MEILKNSIKRDVNDIVGKWMGMKVQQQQHYH